MSLFRRKKKSVEEDYAGVLELYRIHAAEYRRLLAEVFEGYLRMVHEPDGLAKAKQDSDFMELGMRREYLDALDDIEFAIDEFAMNARRAQARAGEAEGTAQGNALARWTASGTQNRELLGIPPTGEKITISGVTMALVSNDKVRSEWTFWEFPELTRRMAERHPVA